MNKSEQINELAIALSKAQGKFKSIPFDKKNPHFGNPYASLTATQNATRDVLSESGLSLTQSIDIDGADYFLETMLIHSSGQWISSKLKLILDKQNMQGLGSAISYAKRYAWQAMLGVVGDEDDDAEAAVRPPRPQAMETKRSEPAKRDPFESVPIDEYVGTFGKYKGQKLKDIDIYELNSYVKFIKESAERDGKEIKGQVLSFVNAAETFLNSRKADSIMDHVK